MNNDQSTNVVLFKILTSLNMKLLLVQRVQIKACNVYNQLLEKKTKEDKETFFTKVIRWCSILKRHLHFESWQVNPSHGQVKVPMERNRKTGGRFLDCKVGQICPSPNFFAPFCSAKVGHRRTATFDRASL